MAKNKKVIWALGFLALIVIFTFKLLSPGVFGLYKKSEHGYNLGALGQIKEAIAGYQKDHGFPPKNLLEITPKYLQEIPEVKLIGYGHWNSSVVESYPFLDAKGRVDPKKLKGTGHWLYDPRTGYITIDCSRMSFGQYPYYDIGTQ